MGENHENHNQGEFRDFKVNLKYPEMHPKYDFQGDFESKCLKKRIFEILGIQPKFWCPFLQKKWNK